MNDNDREWSEPRLNAVPSSPRPVAQNGTRVSYELAGNRLLDNSQNFDDDDENDIIDIMTSIRMHMIADKSYPKSKSANVQRMTESQPRRSRCRPRKPHEVEPFLLVESVQDQWKPQLSLESGTPPASAYSSKLSSPRPSEENCVSYRWQAQVSGGYRPYSAQGSMQSLPDSPRRPNVHIQAPFKHAVQKPAMSPDKYPSPCQDLQQQTIIAQRHLSRLLATPRRMPARRSHGRLLKAKLKPLYPVEVTGPSIKQCRGILAEKRSYGTGVNSTLMRRQQLVARWNAGELDDYLERSASNAPPSRSATGASSLEEVQRFNQHYLNKFLEQVDHEEARNSEEELPCSPVSSPAVVEELERNHSREVDRSGVSTATLRRSSPPPCDEDLVEVSYPNFEAHANSRVGSSKSASEHAKRSNSQSSREREAEGIHVGTDDNTATSVPTEMVEEDRILMDALPPVEPNDSTENNSTPANAVPISPSSREEVKVEKMPQNETGKDSSLTGDVSLRDPAAPSPSGADQFKAEGGSRSDASMGVAPEPGGQREPQPNGPSLTGRSERTSSAPAEANSGDDVLAHDGTTHPRDKSQGSEHGPADVDPEFEATASSDDKVLQQESLTDLSTGETGESTEENANNNAFVGNPSAESRDPKRKAAWQQRMQSPAGPMLANGSIAGAEAKLVAGLAANGGHRAEMQRPFSALLLSEGDVTLPAPGARPQTAGVLLKGKPPSRGKSVRFADSVLPTPRRGQSAGTLSTVGQARKAIRNGRATCKPFTFASGSDKPDGDDKDKRGLDQKMLRIHSIPLSAPAEKKSNGTAGRSKQTPRGQTRGCEPPTKTLEMRFFGSSKDSGSASLGLEVDERGSLTDSLTNVDLGSREDMMSEDFNQCIYVIHNNKKSHRKAAAATDRGVGNIQDVDRWDFESDDLSSSYENSFFRGPSPKAEISDGSHRLPEEAKCLMSGVKDDDVDEENVLWPEDVPFLNQADESRVRAYESHDDGGNTTLMSQNIHHTDEDPSDGKGESSKEIEIQRAKRNKRLSEKYLVQGTADVDPKGKISKGDTGGSVETCRTVNDGEEDRLRLQGEQILTCAKKDKAGRVKGLVLQGTAPQFQEVMSPLAISGSGKSAGQAISESSKEQSRLSCTTNQKVPNQSDDLPKEELPAARKKEGTGREEKTQSEPALQKTGDQPSIHESNSPCKTAAFPKNADVSFNEAKQLPQSSASNLGTGARGCARVDTSCKITLPEYPAFLEDPQSEEVMHPRPEPPQRQDSASSCRAQKSSLHASVLGQKKQSLSLVKSAQAGQRPHTQGKMGKIRKIFTSPSKNDRVRAVSEYLHKNQPFLAEGSEEQRPISLTPAFSEGGRFGRFDLAEGAPPSERDEDRLSSAFLTHWKENLHVESSLGGSRGTRKEVGEELSDVFGSSKQTSHLPNSSASEPGGHAKYVHGGGYGKHAYTTTTPEDALCSCPEGLVFAEPEKSVAERSRSCPPQRTEVLAAGLESRSGRSSACPLIYSTFSSISLSREEGDSEMSDLHSHPSSHPPSTESILDSAEEAEAAILGLPVDVKETLLKSKEKSLLERMTSIVEDLKKPLLGGTEAKNCHPSADFVGDLKDDHGIQRGVPSSSKVSKPATPSDHVRSASGVVLSTTAGGGESRKDAVNVVADKAQNRRNQKGLQAHSSPYQSGKNITDASSEKALVPQPPGKSSKRPSSGKTPKTSKMHRARTGANTPQHLRTRKLQSRAEMNRKRSAEQRQRESLSAWRGTTPPAEKPISAPSGDHSLSRTACQPSSKGASSKVSVTELFAGSEIPDPEVKVVEEEVAAEHKNSARCVEPERVASKPPSGQQNHDVSNSDSKSNSQQIPLKSILKKKDAASKEDIANEDVRSHNCEKHMSFEELEEQVMKVKEELKQELIQLALTSDPSLKKDTPSCQDMCKVAIMGQRISSREYTEMISQGMSSSLREPSHAESHAPHQNVRDCRYPFEMLRKFRKRCTSLGRLCLCIPEQLVSSGSLSSQLLGQDPTSSQDEEGAEIGQLELDTAQQAPALTSDSSLRDLAGSLEPNAEQTDAAAAAPLENQEDQEEVSDVCRDQASLLKVVTDSLPEPPKVSKQKSGTDISCRGENSDLEVVANAATLNKPKASKKKKATDPVAPYPPLCFEINTRPPHGHFFYFAYGLDMNQHRLGFYLKHIVQKRYWGLLFGFSLAFNKQGLDISAGGFPTLEVDPYNSVEGCVYVLSVEHLETLDKCVGAPVHYTRIILPVWMSNSRDPDLGVAQYCVPCMMYIAQDKWINREVSLCSTAALDQCLGNADILSADYIAYQREKHQSQMSNPCMDLQLLCASA